MSNANNYIFTTTAQIGWTPQPHSATDQRAIERYIQDHREQDTYITPNEFKDPTTNTKDNIALFKFIVIDIDNHMAGITQAQAEALTELLKPHFNVDIPAPSRIIYTGRGIHFYIALEPATNIALYDLVAKDMFNKLDILIGSYDALSQVKLHTDKNAIGGYRFIRAEGTKNTKAGTYATGIYASASTHTLEGLVQDYIPALQEIITGKTTAQNMLAVKTGMGFKQYRKEFTAQTWRYGAMQDLKTIQAGRNDDMRRSANGLYYTGNIGTRNNTLFYYGVIAKHTLNDTQLLWDHMLAFNEYYAKHMLSEAEVVATYNSVVSHPYKPPRARTVIQALEITPTEMQSLKVLIDLIEIKRRKRIKENIGYSKKAQERSLKLAGIKAQARALHNAGTPYKVISDQLGISVGKAHYLCN